MDRGLYIAAAGMNAEMVRQDQIANDLANADTPGYKADRAQQRSFKDYLLENTRTGQQIGTIGQGPIITGQTTDFSPQTLESTQEPLDLAVEGEGYFGVKTAAGTRYTRNGQFQQAADGTLADQSGNAVLGKDGKPVKLNADGTVDASKVGLFNLKTPVKQGDNLFNGTASGTPAGAVRTGELESSGVNAGRVVVDMMSSMRAFEAGQKSIQTIDQSLGEAAQQVGSLPS